MTIAKIAATKQEEEGKSSASHFEGITMDSDTILKGEVVEMTLKTGIKTAKLEDKQADDLCWTWRSTMSMPTGSTRLWK
jgi:hypothetical protein